jgi:hypothetical protein
MTTTGMARRDEAGGDPGAGEVCGELMGVGSLYRADEEGGEVA